MINNFEKDEFNYYATALVFGARSPKIKEFQAYSFSILRKYKDIKYLEHSGLNSENKQEDTRCLRIDEKRAFETSHSKMSSGINRIITFIDSEHLIHMSDSIFSDSEFEYFEHNWDAVVKNKIRTVGLLMRSVYQGKIMDMPILINEFPNITKTLFQCPDIWTKRSKNDEKK